ncbi:hypothetical protein CXG81DRAFT_26145 [Caulochytrium protostelioides]|uniref:Uncharacterized protein n=1 Tax=Caulochytrium protostelioides TaxID=1555241 RepID=A0A4P9X7F4_9FUNG|nr:hypothetical protein CXG81DRAFT_26145 [Caulochytrium protostelioides]|eukprot:RKP01177.1 hypothetical protein CXG81DRAFT_26145 [Caulochytrium protostelioides]
MADAGMTAASRASPQPDKLDAHTSPIPVDPFAPPSAAPNTGAALGSTMPLGTPASNAAAAAAVASPGSPAARSKGGVAVRIAHANDIYQNVESDLPLLHGYGDDDMDRGGGDGVQGGDAHHGRFEDDDGDASDVSETLESSLMRLKRYNARATAQHGHARFMDSDGADGGRHASSQEPKRAQAAAPVPEVKSGDECVEDFLRNFLVLHGFTRTMQTFQNELYTLKQTGKLSLMIENARLPDVYRQNHNLQVAVNDLSAEADSYKARAGNMYDDNERFKRESITHRRHRQRIALEKKTIEIENKTLRAERDDATAKLKQLRTTVEALNKELVLLRIEKERAFAEKPRAPLAAPTDRAIAGTEALQAARSAAAASPTAGPIHPPQSPRMASAAKGRSFDRASRPADADRDRERHLSPIPPVSPSHHQPHGPGLVSFAPASPTASTAVPATAAARRGPASATSHAAPPRNLHDPTAGAGTAGRHGAAGSHQAGGLVASSPPVPPLPIAPSNASGGHTSFSPTTGPASGHPHGAGSSLGGGGGPASGGTPAARAVLPLEDRPNPFSHMRAAPWRPNAAVAPSTPGTETVAMVSTTAAAAAADEPKTAGGTLIGAVAPPIETLAIVAHHGPITALRLHPKKPMLASAARNDGGGWKLWGLNGNLIMVGQTQGRSSTAGWNMGSGSGLAARGATSAPTITDLDFSPNGASLITGADDGSVKIWPLTANAGATAATGSSGGGDAATMTLGGDASGARESAVSAVAYHDTGDFVLAGAQDGLTKLWDLRSGKCRQTFRGHAGAIHATGFVPYSNTVVTASGDATVCMWDARTSLCSRTLTAHTGAAVLDFAHTFQARHFGTVDASGRVMVWDAKNTKTPLAALQVWRDGAVTPAGAGLAGPTGGPLGGEPAPVASAAQAPALGGIAFDKSGNTVFVTTSVGAVCAISLVHNSTGTEGSLLTAWQTSGASEASRGRSGRLDVDFGKLRFHRTTEALVLGERDGQIRIFQ